MSRPDTPFARVFIANRGEVAVRVARTCRRLGIVAIAAVAEDDRTSLHARTADDTRAVGSYLDARALASAAVAARADAVHPGWGFLAESPQFAEEVAAAGLAWIGPPPRAMRLAADKIEAKEAAARAGVPTLPSGTMDDVGLPLAVKAAGGGGGRGMRLVRTEEELAAALEAASREAGAAFGDTRVYCERLVEDARHVEVQILADCHGAVWALGERDCSVQRRHQKVLEETPSPGLDEGRRAALSGAAVALAREVGYEGAGTVEFLLDGGDFWFIELNARLQVEHCVTEEVTGLDLVELQLRIAAGEPISRPPMPAGHAVEVRLYAEHPRTFLPQAGRLERLELPAGIRVDTGVEPGDVVPVAYDPLLAKIVARGTTRTDAFARLDAALAATATAGVTTNLPFLRWLVRHPEVRAGRATTAFLDHYPPLSPMTRPRPPFAGWWRLGQALCPPPRRRLAPPQVEDAVHATATSGEAGALTAPMPGIVLRVLADEGARVSAREPLVVLEAMKMEMPLSAPFDATVRSVHVTEGDRVAAGDLLVTIEI